MDKFVFVSRKSGGRGNLSTLGLKTKGRGISSTLIFLSVAVATQPLPLHSSTILMVIVEVEVTIDPILTTSYLSSWPFHFPSTQSLLVHHHYDAIVYIQR